MPPTPRACDAWRDSGLHRARPSLNAKLKGGRGQRRVAAAPTALTLGLPTFRTPSKPNSCGFCCVGPSRSRLNAPRRGDLLLWGPARQGVWPGKPCGERPERFRLLAPAPTFRWGLERRREVDALEFT